MFCGLEAPPICQNTSLVLWTGRTALLLKSPWPHAYWNPWWLFSHSLQCQTRITAPNSHFGSQWSLACSQLLRGVPSFLQFPQFAFLLRQICVCNDQTGRAGLLHSAGLRCFVPFCVPHFLPTRIHTGHGPLAPPRLASALRLLCQVGWNTFAA